MPIQTVEKEEYELVRHAEHVSGGKIKDMVVMVADCVEGVWGAYRILRCWKSFTKYYAELELVEKADNDLHAELLVSKHMNANQPRYR